MVFFKKLQFRSSLPSESTQITEEEASIKAYGTRISKDLKVFYNPIMKLNRDISLLVINSYFKDKKICFCDPMVASGIREIRFLKTIPNKFKLMVLGDISATAIENTKKNIKFNKLGKIGRKNKGNINGVDIQLLNLDAISTINTRHYDFIEVDPFGSPVPFLDIACQRIKHNGILSVTATDTAALCGTYPKTSLRKYGVSVDMTHFYDELGLRNLVAYVLRQAAKYDKVLTPVISYSQDHYYKVFFKVTESRTKAVEVIKLLKYISWDKKSQSVKVLDFEEKNCYGKTYVGKLWDKDLVDSILTSCIEDDLIKDKVKVLPLLEKLKSEAQLDEKGVIGYYNVSKFSKEHKFECHQKFEELMETIRSKGFLASRPHNSHSGIKTNMDWKEFILVMKTK